MTADHAGGRITKAELERWEKSPPIHPAYLNQLDDEKVSYANPPTALDKLAEVLHDT